MNYELSNRRSTTLSEYLTMLRLRLEANAQMLDAPLGSYETDFDLVAGGPGSGCHGDNCGRPSTGQQTLKLPKNYTYEQAKALPRHPTWIPHPDWKKQAYGGILVNSKGEFLLREPMNHFDGYTWTWPKGKMDSPEEHPVDVALREVKQETGYKTAIFARLPGTYTSSQGKWGSHNNFYLMRPKGHELRDMDEETQSLKWVSYDKAKELISQSKNVGGKMRDLAILERAHKRIKQLSDKEGAV